MKYVNFKNIKIKNFLSVGDDVVSVDFNTGLNIITGVNRDKEDRRNGVGKCVDPQTEVTIQIKDAMVLEKFKKFIENQ
jgi:hypothetical protein